MESTGVEHNCRGHGPCDGWLPVVAAEVGVAKWRVTKRGAWLPSDMICCWFYSIRPNRVWLNHPGYTLVAKETAST